MRVDENILAAKLKQHAGMAKPGDDRALMACGNQFVIDLSLPLSAEDRIASFGVACRMEITAQPAKKNLIPRELTDFDV